MLKIDKNKAGTDRACEGSCNEGVASAANCAWTKHVRMLRGSQIVWVCTICEHIEAPASFF